MALDKFQPYLFVSAGEQSNKYLTPAYAGDIAQFQAQRAQSITGLTVRIDPIQEGTGDPAPDNIRPISGRSGMTVTRAGKNLIRNLKVQGNASTVTLGQSVATGRETYLPAGTWTFSYTSAKTCSIYYRDEAADAEARNIRWVNNAKSGTITLTEGTFIRVWAFLSSGISAEEIESFQIEFGTSATDYEPYVGQTYPITWESIAGTVYGGTLDVVSGVLIVEWDYIASYDGETLPGKWISDRDVYEEGTTPTAGAEVAYKLAEPVTYQLTPTDIKTLAGFNQIYSDAGPIIDIQF